MAVTTLPEAQRTTGSLTTGPTRTDALRRRGPTQSLQQGSWPALTIATASSISSLAVFIDDPDEGVDPVVGGPDGDGTAG
jgi:hypothetical protein